jgi:hypothetical protein
MAHPISNQVPTISQTGIQAIKSRLGELYFDGDKRLQREFYEYLTQYPPRFHDISRPLLDLLDRFVHADDAQPIEHPTDELRKLIEEAGKVLGAPLHTPDSVIARSEYRKVENLPNFLANFTNNKNDYYLDIDERILEIPSETDKHEQKLHKHMKEMGEAYRRLLSQIGIQIP